MLWTQQWESGIAASKIKQARTQSASPALKYKVACVNKEFQPKQFYFGKYEGLKQTFVIEL